MLLCALVLVLTSTPAWARCRPENRVWNFSEKSSDFASQEVAKPIAASGENPGFRYDFASGVHKYLYCKDSPLDMADPSGHDGDLISLNISSFISSSIDTFNFGFRMYEAYSKVSTLIDYTKIAVKLVKALDVSTPDQAIASIGSVVRQQFGANDVSALSAGFGGALDALSKHWKDASKAITKATPEMSGLALMGIASHLGTLGAAEASGKLKYVLQLPSGPGTYDSSVKRTVNISKNLAIEVTPNGGSLIGLKLQYGPNETDRIPVIRIDYWDVRVPGPDKVSLHYHVPPDMGAHHEIWHP